MSAYQRPDFLDPAGNFVATLRAYGVARAWLFGSFARGEATESSDIDLLVEFRGDYDYGKLMHLGEDLAAIAGREVDVMTMIKKPFWRFIEPDLIEVEFGGNEPG